MSGDKEQDEGALVKYGGVDGPNSEYIQLTSCDGFVFIIKKDYAFTSETIRAMLGPSYFPFAEAQPNEIVFRNVSGRMVIEVCKYFLYARRYRNSFAEIPRFEIAPEVALDVMLFANFLNC